MGLRFTEVGGKPVGHTHTHRDGRTTPKHNASGSIYWIHEGTKRTYAYIVKCSGVTRVNKGETAATRLICVLNLHVVFWFCLFAIILVLYFSQSVIYLWRNWSLISFCLHLFLEFCIAVVFVLLRFSVNKDLYNSVYAYSISEYFKALGCDAC